MKISIHLTEEHGYFVSIDEKYENHLCVDEVLGVVASAIYSRHAQHVKTLGQHEAYKAAHPYYTVPNFAGNNDPLCVVESIESDTAYNVRIGDKFTGPVTESEALYTVAMFLVADRRQVNWLKTYQQWSSQARITNPVALLR